MCPSLRTFNTITWENTLWLLHYVDTTPTCIQQRRNENMYSRMSSTLLIKATYFISLCHVTLLRNQSLMKKSGNNSRDSWNKGSICNASQAWSETTFWNKTLKSYLGNMTNLKQEVELPSLFWAHRSNVLPFLSCHSSNSIIKAQLDLTQHG